MTVPIGPQRSELARLLNAYNELPNERERIIAEVNRRFRHRLSVMVVDACRFSRTVQDRGVIYFLALLERLERLIVPSITRHNGRLLRGEADNFFAAFPDVESAVVCALTICRDIGIANGPLPRPDEMHVSIGIGYGEMLVIGSHDLFGDEMNLACKLGEDLAGPEEVLLTERAFQALQPGHWPVTSLPVQQSGLSFTAHKIQVP